MRHIVLSRVACVSVSVYQAVKKYPTVYMPLSHKRTIFRRKKLLNMCKFQVHGSVHHYDNFE